MPWPQLVAHLRDNVTLAGAARAELAVRIVAYRTRNGRKAAVAAGVLPALVAAMRAHASAAVQEKACYVLVNITAGTGAQVIARKQAAADAGALPQIVAAMRAHAGSVAVQVQACWALGNITYGHGGHGGEERKQAAADAGALPQCSSRRCARTRAVQPCSFKQCMRCATSHPAQCMTIRDCWQQSTRALCPRSRR
jgi:hypothetical protein